MKSAIEVKLATSNDVAEVSVDDHVPYPSAFKVSRKDGKDFSVYLMMSDIKNNHNKFYIVQVIESIVPLAPQAYLWTRYGRVGNDGVSNRVLLKVASAQR